MCYFTAAGELEHITGCWSHLWREAVSDGGVHGVGRAPGAHEAVRVAREGVASRGQAVGGASFTLPAGAGALVA